MKVGIKAHVMFYVQLRGQQIGPLSKEELAARWRQAKLPAKSLVRDGEDGAWIPILNYFKPTKPVQPIDLKGPTRYKWRQAEYHPRPISIGVVCFLLVVLSGIMLLVLPVAAHTFDGVPIARPTLATTIKIAILTIGLIVNIVTGCYMLSGANWARLLYILYSAAGLIYTTLRIGFSVPFIVVIVIYLASFFVLIQPQAAQYFRGNSKV